MLVAYTVALDLIRALRPVVAQLRKHSPEAADQVERAASSIVHNLAEGSRRNGRDPKRFFDMRTAAPARSAVRSTWQMRGAGRLIASRHAPCLIASSGSCSASLDAAALRRQRLRRLDPTTSDCSEA